MFNQDYITGLDNIDDTSFGIPLHRSLRRTLVRKVLCGAFLNSRH